jgi:methionyl-tRNA synthetase
MGLNRTVVSGIALHYTPEELPGMHVVILANLEPRKYGVWNHRV